MSFVYQPATFDENRGMTTQQPVRDRAAILIPAAGAGVRLGAGVPKALHELAGEPLLAHAVRRVAASGAIDLVVVAAPPSALDTVTALLKPIAEVTVVPGGATRQLSVAAALAVVPGDIGIVLVHDAARALVPPSLVDDVVTAVRAGHDAVIPVLPVADTVKEVSPDGYVAGTVDRATLRRVQTPQGFRRAVLDAAHAAATSDHTDDAGMVEKIGGRVYCVPGSEYAMKITNRFDLLLAEALLRQGA